MEFPVLQIHRPKIYYFVSCFGGRRYWKHYHMHTVKLIYRTSIVGHRQVTVRFTNYKNFAKSLEVVQGHAFAITPVIGHVQDLNPP